MSSKRKRTPSSEFDLKSIMAANGESDMEIVLEETYQCKDFSDITKCFMNLHQTITSDMLKVKKEITTMKQSIVDVEKSLEHTQAEVSEIFEYNLPTINERIDNERIERLKLDLWGRKWNLIVTGIVGFTSLQKYY